MYVSGPELSVSKVQIAVILAPRMVLLPVPSPKIFKSSRLLVICPVAVTVIGTASALTELNNAIPSNPILATFFLSVMLLTYAK